MSTSNGKKVISRRRKVGRKFLTASTEFKLLRKKPLKAVR